MARFQFQRRPSRPVAPLPEASTAAAPGFEAAFSHGPGWFESSWELVRGLVVREGLPDKPSVEEWLGAYLCEPTLPTGPRRGAAMRLAS